MHLAILWSTILGCGQEQIIEKVENLPPQILITSHTNDAMIVEGFETEFRASVSDDDNQFSDLVVRWSNSGNVICDWTPVSQQGESFCPFSLTPSTSQVIAEVKDPQGAAGVSEINPTVRSNLPPTASILSPSDGNVYYGNDLVEFRMNLDDAEESPSELVVMIESTVDGVLFTGSPDSAGLYMESRYLSPGQHVLSITITDTGGANIVRNMSILVKPDNEAPTCQFVSPAPDTNVLGGNAIDFILQVDDVNIPNDTIEVKLTSSIDGFLPIPEPDANGQILYTMPNFTLGRHSMTLSAFDERGLECSVSQLLVIDSVPVVSIQQPLDGYVFSIGEIVEFQGRVLDNEDLEHEMTLEWSSDVNGSLHSDLVNAQGRQQFFYDLLDIGPHVITASSTDSGGHTSTTDITIRINTPPTATQVSFSPEPLYSDQDLQAVPYGATDVDGDTIGYTYEWFKNGVLQPYTTDTIPASQLYVDDEWSVTVTTDDGYDGGPSHTEAIIVSNTTPTFTTPIALSTTEAEVGGSIVCSASAEDLDDGVLTTSFEWTYNGSVVGSTNLFTVPIIATIGDIYQCTVTATDSNGATITDTTYTTVINTLPIVQSPIIVSSDGNYFVDSQFTCSTSVTDPNETLTPTYQWIVSGSVLDTGPTIDLGTYTILPGDTVTCQASAEDSEGETDTASIDVTLCAFSTCDESIHVGNGIGIDMTLIQNGSFVMGSSPGEPGRDGDESQFPATLTNDYYMSTTEITQGMYEMLMGDIWTAGQSTLSGEGNLHPVAYISWHMAADYTNALTQYYNQMNGTSLSNCYSCLDAGTSSASCITLGNPYQCTGFRLPTEVEWEFAAKAGTTSTYWTSNGGGNLPSGNIDSCTIGWTLDDGSALGDYAWYCARNIVDSSKEIGQNLPNGNDLYDMHGNVWEWCHDGYSSIYPINTTTNYVQVSPGNGRVLRGGSWQDEPQDLRIGNRHSQPPLYRMPTVGLRIVRGN